MKIGYWQAIDAGDIEQADLLAREAGALADDLKHTKKP